MRFVFHVCAGLCALHCASPPLAAQPGSDGVLPMSESQVLERVMAGDPRVRAVRARTDEVRAVSLERTLRPNPGFSLTRESAGGTADLFVTAQQELPLWGRPGLLREAGGRAIEAARLDADYQVQQIRADARLAYTRLLLAQERERTLRAEVANLQRLLDWMRLREDAGEGSRYDRLRGARAMVDLQDLLARAHAQRTAAQGALAVYLGPGIRPESVTVTGTLGGELSAPPLDTLLTRALAHRADYQALAQSSAQRDAERRAAERLQLPSPIVGAGIKQTTIAGVTSTGYQFSLGLTLPLANRGQSAVALAGAQAARARAEGDTLRLQIETAVRTAHAILQQRLAHLDTYRRLTAETVEPVLAIARVAYDEGELGILELLDANGQALDARLRALEISAEAREAAIELERVAGQEALP